MDRDVGLSLDGFVNLLPVAFPESSHRVGLPYRGFRLARSR